MNAVRLSLKAIVVRDGSLLVLRCVDDEGDWFLLPGGGQEVGETVHEALQRECLEEVGCGVEIHRLLFIRDYIAKHHEFAATEGDAHQVELMFECTLRGEPGEPSLRDTAQVGHVWLPLREIGSHRFYPRALGSRLAAPWPAEAVYLGDCN